MSISYNENTLYVDMFLDINFENIKILERRVFGLIDTYGFNNIVINLSCYNNILVNNFKKNYYHKYKGFLDITTKF